MKASIKIWGNIQISRIEMRNQYIHVCVVYRPRQDKVHLLKNAHFALSFCQSTITPYVFDYISAQGKAMYATTWI